MEHSVYFLLAFALDHLAVVFVEIASKLAHLIAELYLRLRMEFLALKTVQLERSRLTFDLMRNLQHLMLKLRTPILPFGRLRNPFLTSPQFPLILLILPIFLSLVIA